MSMIDLYHYLDDTDDGIASLIHEAVFSELDSVDLLVEAILTSEDPKFRGDTNLEVLGSVLLHLLEDYAMNVDMYREIIEADDVQREDLGHSQEEEDRLANPLERP